MTTEEKIEKLEKEIIELKNITKIKEKKWYRASFEYYDGSKTTGANYFVRADSEEEAASKCRSKTSHIYFFRSISQVSEETIKAAETLIKINGAHWANPIIIY